MKKGFTLIEVVIAIMLASLISLSLFRLLNQTRRAVTRITNVIDVDMPLIGFASQLEKDVTGMFAPQSSIEAFAKKDKEKTREEEKKKVPFYADKEKEPEPLPSKPIEHVFELDAKKGTFFWSFITTGGIQVLDSEGNITPVPFVRRVAYLLEKDPQRPDLYRMMYRFSGTDLELASFKSAKFKPSYELMGSIKQLSIELTVKEVVQKEPQEEPKKDQKKPEKPVEKPLIPLRSIALKEWKPDEIWDKYKTLIPAYVKLSGIRLDATGAEYPFEMVHKVYAYSPYVEKEKTLFEALEDIAKSIWKKK